MGKIEFEGKEWKFEVREKDILLLTPTGSTIILDGVHSIVSHAEVPTAEDILWHLKFNNNVLPRHTQEEYEKFSKKDEDFECFNEKVHQDPYYLKWGHTYQVGVHWVNCDAEESIPQEYKNKSLDFKHISVQQVPKYYNEEEFSEFIAENNYELLTEKPISLYFRYEDDLSVDNRPEKIIRALTEHQLRSTDVIGITLKYSRGEEKPGYFYIYDVVLLKKKN